MESQPHPFQNIDYGYLRANESHIIEKTREQLYYCDKNGKQCYRQIFSGLDLPGEQKANIEKLHFFLEQDCAVNLPPYWTIYDTYRYLECCGFKEADARRDVMEHCEYIKKKQNFVLRPESAEILKNGNVRIVGRDSQGYTNI